MDLFDLKNTIEPKLRKGYVTSKVLLGRARFIDDTSVKSPAFNDPAYLPFYFHLGGMVKATSLVHVGLDLGLPASCLAQGCPSLTDVLGFQRQGDEFYSSRLAVGNVRDHFKGNLAVHVGEMADAAFAGGLGAREWDVAVVTDRTDYAGHRAAFESLWGRMAFKGILVVDFLSRHEPLRRAFDDFCRASNRDPVTVATRYTVGIIQR